MRRRVKAQEIKDNRTRRASLRVVGGRIKRILFFFLLCMGGIGSGFLWLSGTFSYFYANLQEDFFAYTQKQGIALKIEMIEGAFRTSTEDINKCLGALKGDSLFKIDPWIIKEQLEKLPWVHSALVERRFPETLYIRLSEKYPLARWQHQKKIDLIDERGSIISLPKNKEASSSLPFEFTSLPLFVGEGAEKKGPIFLKILEKYPLLLSRMTAATLVNERRWNVYLDKSLEIKLPEEQIDQALKVLSSLNNQGILSNVLLKGVDLRYLPKIIVRPRDEKAYNKEKEIIVPLSKKAKST